MKTSLRLLLVCLLLLQVVAPLVVAIPCCLYLYLTTGTITQSALFALLLMPAQLVGQLFIAFYLWQGGYVDRRRQTWHPVSATYLGISAVAILTAGFLLSELMELLEWIPNLMQQELDFLQTGGVGILALTLMGPVAEELLFRGAISRSLQQQGYRPVAVALLSSLLFGVFHLNPAQMLPAFLAGLLLSWSYLSTGSLVPCTLMHILNNSLSVCLGILYPGIRQMSELLPPHTYPFALGGALVLLLLSLGAMHRLHRNAPAKW